MAGGVLVVGAALSGAAYVFEQDPIGAWVEVAKLTPSDGGGLSSRFGISVATDGPTIAVGAFNRSSGRGAVYLFERDGGGVWTESAILQAGDAQAGDSLGISVDVDGDVVVAGARFDDDLGDRSGSAYIFERVTAGGVWVQSSKLTASDGGIKHRFGDQVAVSGTRVVVGAPFYTGLYQFQGKAYIFESDLAGVWVQVADIVAADAGPLDGFGSDVDVVGDVIAVLAPGVNDAFGDRTGGVYIYEPDGAGGWSQTGTRLVPSALNGGFILRLSLSPGVLVTGWGILGAAFVFEETLPGVWVETTRLLPSDGVIAERFGEAVTVADGIVVVTASSHDDPVVGFDNGAAYVYEISPGTLVKDPKYFGERRSIGKVADPVNIATGNYLSSATDLPFGQSTFGLHLVRSYNSQDDIAGSIGRGWLHSFDDAVHSVAGDGSVTLRLSDGRHVVFTSDGSGGFDRPNEFYGELVDDGDGSYSVDLFDGSE